MHLSSWTSCIVFIRHEEWSQFSADTPQARSYERKGDAQISLGVARGGLEERGGAGLVRRDDGLVTDVVRKDVVVLLENVDGVNV